MDNKDVETFNFNNKLDILNSTLRENNHLDDFNQSLNIIFPQASEQTRTQKTRQILGDVANELLDEQLETYTVQFEYLVGCWLDVFEKNLFDGKTLKELLKLT
jgi:hypothetical protein